ncbi:hypothetical protein PanWU01x14_246460 [Parasponia andersonii]|uniref:Uncharacterized protein n=1 Tax=Parasponia andersonii TaxID=3476 RepID=A0A2P5BEB8_PARAD|nr:hypothetical protein PanWU01x14_246460 [Parasponia andersonii]
MIAKLKNHSRKKHEFSRKIQGGKKNDNSNNEPTRRSASNSNDGARKKDLVPERKDPKASGKLYGFRHGLQLRTKKKKKRKKKTQLWNSREWYGMVWSVRTVGFGGSVV